MQAHCCSVRAQVKRLECKRAWLQVRSAQGVLQESKAMLEAAKQKLADAELSAKSDQRPAQ